MFCGVDCASPRRAAKRLVRAMDEPKPILSKGALESVGITPGPQGLALLYFRGTW